MAHLSRLIIDGYKSIRTLDLPFNSVNVLIGANGSGKTNLVSFFTLLNRIMRKELQLFVGRAGGPDAILRHGRAVTPKISARLYFGMNGYFFDLIPTNDNKLIFENENLWFEGFYFSSTTRYLGSGHSETLAPDQLNGGPHQNIARFVVPSLLGWKVYHFHDTSDTARLKQPHDLNDNAVLQHDASNIAAFLYAMRETSHDNYLLIRDVIRLVAPFFADFHLRPSPLNPTKIQLEWTETGSEQPLLGHQLSDGTLRFMCLATLLLQPNRPTTIIIDEPELGLHPVAISLLANLIKSTAENGTQIILSTQSVPLLDEFDPDDVIVVDRNDGSSEFRRLQEEQLSGWLENYSLGELWTKNVIGGKPHK